MSEVLVTEQSHGDEDFDYDEESTNSTDTEEYLDLDLNDFMDCNAAPIWQTDKQKVIERLIENCCDTTSFEEVCFSRGGLVNGITFHITELKLNFCNEICRCLPEKSMAICS